MTAAVDSAPEGLARSATGMHRQPRSHGRGLRRGLLLAILVIGLLRGLFWLAAYPVPFGDETAQVAYIQSLATGHGVPVTGRDFVQLNLIEQYKANAAAGFSEAPLRPASDPKIWGLAAEQYEAYQTPAYHIVMVPFWWVGHLIDGSTGALLALRLASWLLVLTTVPLLYLLGRELVPRSPAVWLLAPIIFTTIQITAAHGALVDNDSAAAPASAFALLSVLRLRSDLTFRRVLLAGFASSLLLLAKGTGVAMLPILGALLLWIVVRARPSPARLAKLAVIAAIPVIVMWVPWLLFNLHAYHALSGGKQDGAVVAPVIGSFPTGWNGVHRLLSTSAANLFAAEVFTPATVAVYRHLWEITGAIAAGAGLLVGLARRRWQRSAAFAVVGVGVPAGWLLLAVFDVSQSGAQATIAARHLNVLLPVFVLTVAVGAVDFLGSRVGPVVVLSLCVAAAFIEIGPARAWIRTTYTAGTFAGAAPVEQQRYSDNATASTGVSLVASCPAKAVGVVLLGSDPPTATVNGGAPIAPVSVGIWKVYPLPQPVTGPIDVHFARTVGVADTSPDKSTLHPVPALESNTGVAPTVESFCAVGDLASFRFHQTYAPQHPWPMSLAALSDWPVVSAGLVAVEGMAVLAFLGVFVRRRREETPA